MSAPATRTVGFLTVAILATGLVAFTPSDAIAADPVAGATYYLDASSGDDTAAGTTPETPWKTLDRLDEVAFQPGDHILLKAGETWEGQQLDLTGSGAEDAPIIVDTYGTGAKPRIAAAGAHADAVRLWNADHWAIRNLDVSNAAFVTDPVQYNAEGRAGDYRGILIGGDDGRAHHGFEIDAVDVHDVTGEVRWIGERSGYTPPNGISFGNGWDRSKNTGGIVVLGTVADIADPGPTATTFHDVVIENSTVQNTSFGAITVKQYTGDAPGAVATGWGDRATADDANFSPHTDIVIRDNYITQTGTAYGANGIYVTGAKGVLVERNLVDQVGTCGIEAYNADDVVIQHNEVNYTRVKAGGQDFNAIDTDVASTNQIVQYNFVYGNGEGFLIYQKRFGDAVFRYNVIAASTKAQIHIASDAPAHGRIYNNTIIDSGATSVISGGTQAGKYTLQNNIFFSSTGNATSTGNNNLTYTRNLYAGVAPRPQESDAQVADPGFTDVTLTPPVTGVVRAADLTQALGLVPVAGSRAVNTATEVEDNGGRDYRGVTVYQGDADFGAFEYTTPAGQGTETVVGRITSSATGSPVVGAEVTASGAPGRAISASDGWYALDGVPFGADITVTIQRAGFATRHLSGIAVGSGTSARADAALVATATTGTVSGRVIDVTGSAISGATVSLLTGDGSIVSSAESGTEGAFSIEVPVGSDYRVTVSTPDHLAAVRTHIAVEAALDTAVGNIILSGRDVHYEVVVDFEDKAVGGTDVAPFVAAQVNGTVMVDTQDDDRFARLSRTSAGGSSAPATSMTYEPSSPLTGVVTIEQKVRRPAGQPSAQFFGAPYVRNAAGQNLISIGWSGGTISAYDGATHLAEIGTYTADTWVTVRLVVDTDAQTYSVYLDGQAVLHNAGLRNPIGAGVAAVATYADGPNRGVLDINDFRIARGIGYSTSETSLNSLESSVGALQQLDATTYRLDVGADDQTTVVTATALSPFARATTVRGQAAEDGVEVELDGSPIEVVVAAEDGTRLGYRIEVRKPTGLRDDSARVDAGESVISDVLANDGTSPLLDSGSLTLLDAAGTPAVAVISDRGVFTVIDGEVRFTADSDATAGDVSVAYRVTNATGAVSTATLTVTVVPRPDGPQAPAWSATQVYLAGAEVSHAGAVYVAQWWTQGQRPGASAYGAWAERGPSVVCAARETAHWTSSWIYTGGETVVHDGERWQAKWWTRNQAPGDAAGPWRSLGSC